MTKPISHATTARFSRALIVGGLLLASATGCQMETTAPPAEEEAVHQSSSAVGSTYFDFIANAPGAAWYNDDGGVSWGLNDPYVKGTCLTTTGPMEDGVTRAHLLTKPKYAFPGFMRASYTVTIPAANQHPTATATFGYTTASGSGTLGVTFSLKTNVNGTWVTLFSQQKMYTGALSTQTADLSAYAGQTLQLVLSADGNNNPFYDYSAWTDFRIVTDNVVSQPSDGCNIGGVAYATGAANPASSCRVCDPDSSTTAWSIRSDSCFIGGQCYVGEQQDPLKCNVCDPLTSQTTWTSKAQCDNLVVAVTNTDRTGDFGGYLYQSLQNADGFCAADGASLGLPGTWKAMLSTVQYFGQGTARNLKDAVLDWAKTRPVVNLQGQQLYATWNDIFTNQVWPSGLSMYRFNGSTYAGTPFTNSNAAGVWDGSLGGGFGNNCFYNMYSYGYYAKVGDYSTRKLLDSGFPTSNPATVCSNAKAIACVLMPPTTAVTTTPPAPVTPQSVEATVTVENYDGTAEGTIQGMSHGDSYVWRGIPYAAAPTGSLRFAPPAKVTSWTGVRNTFIMPTLCAQKGFFPGPSYVGSEDCLYLNVWTPKTATTTSNLPVMVFHHGGGLMYGGAGAVDEVVGIGMYNGNRLAAAQNMVVVTIQTRLAAFGYLALPELSANATSRTSTTGGGTSGNYGLLDGLQALKWVKRNISKFGGDPNHVLMSGQSGGATLAALLLASPLAKDPADNKPYFSSALMMSGFYEEPPMATRYTQSTAMLPIAGCQSASDKVACLRSAATNDLTAMAGDFLTFVPDALNAPINPTTAFGLKLGPSIDGYVVPVQPRSAYAAGTHQKVPVIVGSTKNEFSSFLVTAVAGLVHALTTGDIHDMVFIATCGDYVSRVDMNLGTTLSATARALYPCSSGFYLNATLAYRDAITHVQYECPVRRSARALVAGPSPQPVRRYMFSHNADHIGLFQNLLGLVPQVGAAHALDLPYVFNTHSTIVLGIPTYWPSSRERELTTRYGKYIRAFAATGDPNYTGGVTWTAYSAASDNALSLKVVGETGGSDPGPQMITNINTSYCDFWDNNFTLDGWK